MDRCIKCDNTIKDEYFEGVHGKICVCCIKDMHIYTALKNLGLIKNVKADEV